VHPMARNALTAVAVSAAAVSVLVPLPALAATPALAGPAAAAHEDFDGDGRPDLAVGAPAAAGAVRVKYTHAAAGNAHVRIIRRAPSGGSFAAFGSALASGDFNRDGHEDLAVGAPGFVHNADGTQQGAVFVYNGTANGLTATGFTVYGPNNFDDANELGAALTAGDFNGDGFDDLAVANPGPAGGGDDTGSVRLYFGSASGLTSTGAQFLDQNSPGIKGSVGSEHQFGAALTAADVDGDGHLDLVVGVPGAGSSVTDFGAGGVEVIFGNAHGLAPRSQLVLASAVHAKGDLGDALAHGDVNRDGRSDVVAGAPTATVNGHEEAGKVVVLLGGKHGLSARRSRTLSEDTTGVPGTARTSDGFGAALAVRPLVPGGFGAVAIGVPRARAGQVRRAGALVLLRGARHGVTTTRAQRWTRSSKGVPGKAAKGDGFGSAVALTNPTAHVNTRAIIGIPFADIGGVNGGGAYLILRSRASGLTPAHAQQAHDGSTLRHLGAAICR
jgi:FG-GAP repeat/FG-GAP-like repeat